MSGIIGSSHNIRGSGLVAKLGTDGQVFTSAGAGVKQTFEDAAGGGAWTLIATQTASDTDLIEFDTDEITSTYDVYKFFLTNIHADTDNVKLYIQFRQDSSYLTSSYRWSTCRILDNGTVSGAGSTSSSYMQLMNDSTGNATGEASSWEITLWDPLGTNNDKLLHYEGVNITLDTVVEKELGAGAYYGDQAALDGIKFYFSGGLFASGTFAIYGLAKS